MGMEMASASSSQVNRNAQSMGKVPSMLRPHLYWTGIIGDCPQLSSPIITNYHGDCTITKGGASQTCHLLDPNHGF